MVWWLIARLRGGEDGFTAVFSRLRVAHKAIGMHLLQGLIILVWMIPGMIVMGLSMLPVMRAESADAAMSAMNGTLFLLYAGLILMAVLGIQAALRSPWARRSWRIIRKNGCWAAFGKAGS